ncbi:MAG TPA: ferritin-like domain-containing protein [Longimicrobium sp.]|nr:ferritin-like domain-containing protein [Longimicrobium sp.]
MPVRPVASVPFAVPTCTRRGFLRLAIAGGSAALLPFAAACNDDPFDPAAQAFIDLRTEDGLLNGVYALLQLKGELFHRVYTTPFVGMTRAERDVFLDVRDHTAAHIRYISDQLGTRRIYDLLLFDFAAVDLSGRAAALGRARALCDEVSAAHAWMLPRLVDSDTRLVMAKAASVHARHAAVLGAMEQGPEGWTTGIDGATGLAAQRPLADALEAARPFFLTMLDVRS